MQNRVTLIEIIKLIWKLPELWEFYQAHKERIVKLDETIARFDLFVTEIAENLDNISKAASLITSGYAQASTQTAQILIAAASPEKLDEQIEHIEGVINALNLTTAVGSMQINAREETLSSLQTQLIELKNKRRELGDATGTTS